MLLPEVVSRDSSGNKILTHNVAGGTYSAAPVNKTDGFKVRDPTGQAFDAFEMTYSYDGGFDSTTMATIRPWFWVPDHNPTGSPTGKWVSASLIERISSSAGSSDIASPVRRLNSVPTGATYLYMQVTTIAGTAPTNLYMVVFGIDGMVADVAGGEGGSGGGGGGIVKLEDATTGVLARVAPANTVHTATDDVVWVQPLGEDGEVLEGGSGGAGGGAGVYSVAQGDFTAAYTAATQITLAGGPTGVISDINFIQVDQFQAADVAVAWKPDGNQFSYNAATGVLTVTGATFAATDTFDVKIWYTPKAYDTSGNQNIIWRSNPDYEQNTSSTPISISGQTDGTYYYYLDMDSYRKSGFQIDITPGSGSVTVTLEGSIQDDGTAAASCAYTDITYDVFNLTNTTVDDMWIDDIEKLSVYKYVRFKAVFSTGGSNDGGLVIFAKRLY